MKYKMRSDRYSLHESQMIKMDKTQEVKEVLM